MDIFKICKTVILGASVGNKLQDYDKGLMLYVHNSDGFVDNKSVDSHIHSASIARAEAFDVASSEGVTSIRGFSILQGYKPELNDKANPIELRLPYRFHNNIASQFQDPDLAMVQIKIDNYECHIVYSDGESLCTRKKAIGLPIVRTVTLSRTAIELMSAFTLRDIKVYSDCVVASNSQVTIYAPAMELHKRKFPPVLKLQTETYQADIALDHRYLRGLISRFKDEADLVVIAVDGKNENVRFSLVDFYNRPILDTNIDVIDVSDPSQDPNPECRFLRYPRGTRNKKTTYIPLKITHINNMFKGESIGSDKLRLKFNSNRSIVELSSVHLKKSVVCLPDQEYVLALESSLRKERLGV